MTAGELVTLIVSGAGGGAIAAALVVKGIGKAFVDAALQQLKHRNDAALEELRAERSQQSHLIATVLSTRHTESLAAQERRLQAIEKLWSAVLALRDSTNTILFPYSILIRSEYGLAFTKPIIAAGLPTSASAFLTSTITSSDTCEVLRPFLGEKLWVMFWVYRGVILRLAYRVLQARDDGQPLPLWHEGSDGKPEHVLAFARFVLTDAEIKAAVDLKFNGPRTLIELIEQKLLLEIDRRISGTSTADMTIAESRRLVEALTTVTMQQQ